MNVICGLPATYTLYIACFMIRSFSCCCFWERSANKTRFEIKQVRYYRWRVVCVRGAWYPHKQQAAAESFAAEHGTLGTPPTLPRAHNELALDPNPSSHRHPRRTSFRYVRRFQPVTHQETENRVVEGLESRVLSALRVPFLDARWTFSFASLATVPTCLSPTRGRPALWPARGRLKPAKRRHVYAPL